LLKSIVFWYYIMTKRAILIGCNYDATPSVKLAGCINDIVHMRNALIDAYGYQDDNVYMLRDDSPNQLPTRRNILYLLTQLVSASDVDDMVWVHYSGHGVQVLEPGLGSQDGIVPCDYNTAGIIDQVTLNNIIKNAKCKMMVCFDSGSQCSLEYSINYNGSAFSKTVNNSKRIANANIIMLSRCQDSQTSADTYDNMEKKNVGAFTQTLLETLRQNDHNVALLPLYSQLCANLKTEGFAQIPVLSSSAHSPSFQFSKANANGSSVLSNSVSPYAKKKDFVLSGNNSIAASPVTNPMRGLMDKLII